MTFWNQIKRFFHKNGDNSLQKGKETTHKLPEEILLEHAIIQRSATELEAFEHWGNSYKKRAMLQWIYDEYQQHKSCCCSNRKIHFMVIPSVNGFVMQLEDSDWGNSDIISLFDYFKQVLRSTENYKTHISDYKITQQGENTSSTERHYLKPPRKFDLSYGEQMDQKFGNIMITLSKVNKKILILKLSATHYNDSMYQKAKCFDQLIDTICIERH